MILDDLVSVTLTNMAQRQRLISPEDMYHLANQNIDTSLRGQQFMEKLHQPEITIIGEIKQASPSKGQIVTTFNYEDIARDYQTGGVDMISVLTETDYFKGSLDILRDVRAIVDVPILRKDFTVDAYMIDEARVNGAQVVLLIVAILSDEQLVKFLQRTHELGMVAIVETHDQEEIQRAIEAGAQIIGVNNRNLKDFSVNIHHTLALRQSIPEHIALIAESGIRSAEEIHDMSVAGVNGFLIGETLMRASDKAQQIKTFKAAYDD